MVTKAELEDELSRLRAQNEELKRQSAQAPEGAASTDTEGGLHFPKNVQDFLDEHGIDSATLEAAGGDLSKELTALQREYPMATLLGAFVVGCLLGRALK